MMSSARVFEIGRDRSRRRDDVAVRHHHALGKAGRSRGIDQHGEIDVDAGHRTAARAWLQAQRPAPKRARRRLLIVSDEGIRRSPRSTIGNSSALGQDRAGAAIVEHIGKLVGLGRGIDRAEDAAGFQHGENGDDGLPAIVHEDDDAIAALDARCGKCGREPVGRRVEIGVAHAAWPPGPARACRKLQGALAAETFDPHVSSSLTAAAGAHRRCSSLPLDKATMAWIESRLAGTMSASAIGMLEFAFQKGDELQDPGRSR